MQTQLQDFDAPAMGMVEIPLQKEQKWLAVSLLQKAIRRGDAPRAMSWANALWKTERSYGLYRMMVIATEEIACANPDLAAAFIQTQIRKSWFEQNGGVKALQYFAHHFALSEKDRSSCDLAYLASVSALNPPKAFIQASLDPLALREDPAALSAMALDKSADTRARAAALWLLAGSRRCPNPYWGEFEGSWNHFLDAIHAIGGSDPRLLLCSQLSLEVSKEPNPIAICLVHEQKKDSGHAVSSQLRRASETLGVVPLAGVDTHTREGKRAISQWAAQSKPVQALLSKVPRRDQSDALGSALFRLEGHECAPRQVSPLSERITLACEHLVSRPFKIPAPELFAALVAQLDGLDAQRALALSNHGFDLGPEMGASARAARP